jgi:hypothetical protein
VIDWDRSERYSPILLDVLAASHFHAFRTLAGGGWGSTNYWKAWRLHLAGDKRLMFRREFRASAGELDWTDAISFAVLNTIYWDCSEQRHRAGDFQTYAAWINECEAYVRSQRTS